MLETLKQIGFTLLALSLIAGSMALVAACGGCGGKPTVSTRTKGTKYRHPLERKVYVQDFYK